MFLEDVEAVEYSLDHSRRGHVGGKLLGLHPELDFVTEFAEANLAYVRPLVRASVAFEYRVFFEELGSLERSLGMVSR